METKMRVMAIALASMLAVFVADSQAFAAKRDSSVTNLGRQYYAYGGSCSGSNAYCYRSSSQKHSKKKH
jgi:hypothetical protein